MRVLKIIGGLALLIFSAILTLATIMSFLNSLPQIRREIAESISGGIGYLFGSMLVVIALIALIYFSVKKALKLLQPKQLREDTIDDIG